MTKQDLKHALVSLVIGALIAFLSTLFQGLLDFLKANSAQIIGGASATVAYLIRTHHS